MPEVSMAGISRLDLGILGNCLREVEAELELSSFTVPVLDLDVVPEGVSGLARELGLAAFFLSLPCALACRFSRSTRSCSGSGGT